MKTDGCAIVDLMNNLLSLLFILTFMVRINSICIGSNQPKSNLKAALSYLVKEVKQE